VRGSIRWQTGELAKAVFEAGVSKVERINPESAQYGKIASYGTMETYRESVWNPFGQFVKEEHGVKDFEKITAAHVVAYMEKKVEEGVAKQTLEKISSGLGALERALNLYGKTGDRDFSARFDVLHQAKELGQLRDGYHDRAYNDPQRVISNLRTEEHRIGARIQVKGGARLEGVSLIKLDQLKGLGTDRFTGKTVGVIYTEEKGGKGGTVMMSPETYADLKDYIEEHGRFSLDEREYQRDVEQAARAAGEDPEGTHGFRWNFAQERVEELQAHKLTHEEARQEVSWEMKHERGSITDHYLFGS
jgi:integrase